MALQEQQQKLNFTNNVTSDIQAQFNNRYTGAEADAAFGTLSSVGDLGSGSITPGFGNIDVGSSRYYFRWIIIN